MAPEPWNRTDIPRPAIQCQVTVPPGESTEKCVKKVIDTSSAAHSALKSEALNAEVETMNSILYVYHHQLGYHKPYLALKQVQQCTKRLKSMGLEDSLKEIMDLCPKEAELQNSLYCTLPSQPILELVSMKILGSCKLLVRLLDCSCKAFHLCLQHLKLEEFIVMNVVLLGLLSRLWVMYKGLLKHLIAFYSAHITLQKAVSDFQKVPYFKDFVFPTTIEDHIDSDLSDLVPKKLQNLFCKRGSAQFLNKIFDTSNLVKEKKLSEIGVVDVKQTKRTLDDVGQPVQMQSFNRGKLNTFDVKTLFLPVKARQLQAPGCKKKSNESKEKHDVSQHSREKECVIHLMPKIREAEDFKALSKQLLYAIKWCKERKLKTEAMFLRSRYLRCNRLQHAEALGYSLKKKLQCWKKSMCHGLRVETLRKDHLKKCLRTQRFRRTWKHVVTLSHRHRRVKRKGFKRSPLCLDVFPKEQVPAPTASEAALRPPMSKLQESHTQERGPCLTDTDDIDDIFSSIGV